MKVEKAIEDRVIVRRYSKRMGPSSIGGPCPRATWYKFRWAQKLTLTPRQERLFSRGDREEPIIIADLERIGVKVLSKQEYANFCNGHACAFSDGKILGVPDAPKTPHLLEIKTANKKNFEALNSCKSVKKWKPGYYDQVQVYLKLYNLKRCLFIVACKDDDRRYYERIRYDKDHAELLIEKFNHLIYLQKPPIKASEESGKYPCIFCDYYKACWQGKIDKNCRTCRHLVPVEKGEWKCLKKGKIRSHKKQELPCSRFQRIA